MYDRQPVGHGAVRGARAVLARTAMGPPSLGPGAVRGAWERGRMNRNVPSPPWWPSAGSGREWYRLGADLLRGGIT